MDMLMTDWGSIPLPDDMKNLCRIRKDGWPDQRFSNAKVWERRFREEGRERLAQVLETYCTDFIPLRVTVSLAKVGTGSQNG